MLLRKFVSKFFNKEDKFEKFIDQIDHDTFDEAYWKPRIINKEIDIHAADERAFRRSCAHNKLKVAQFLWNLSVSLDQPINIHAQNEDAFRGSCFNSNLQMAQWLYSLDNTINIHTENEQAFICSCENGHLPLAQWLYSLDNTIDIHTNNEEAFIESCGNGHLQVAQWLYSLDNTIDIHAEDECAFVWSCQNGHLQVAQWLYFLNNTIDIHVEGEAAFRFSCYHDRLQVAEWLCEIEPTYQIIVQNGKINYKIISPIDTFLSKNDDESHKQALAYLKITNKITVSEAQQCFICLEPHNRIIKLKCDHYVCLEGAYEWFKNNTKQCVYCKKPFRWSDCSNVVTFVPTDSASMVPV